MQGKASDLKAGTDQYVVKPCDTGVKIARAIGTSLADMEAVNPLVDWSRLKVGQNIKIPGYALAGQAHGITTLPDSKVAVFIENLRVTGIRGVGADRASGNGVWTGRAVTPAARCAIRRASFGLAPRVPRRLLVRLREFLPLGQPLRVLAGFPQPHPRLPPRSEFSSLTCSASLCMSRVSAAKKNCLQSTKILTRAL